MNHHAAAAITRPVLKPEDRVLIWSYEHDGWWRANSRGYTSLDVEAGLYLRSEANEIVSGANFCGKVNETVREVGSRPPTHGKSARRFIWELQQLDAALALEVDRVMEAERTRAKDSGTMPADQG